MCIYNQSASHTIPLPVKALAGKIFTITALKDSKTIWLTLMFNDILPLLNSYSQRSHFTIY